MALSRSRVLYIAAMLVSGILIGLVVRDRPSLREAAIPPYVWPFLVSFVLDVALGQAVARGMAAPLTMSDRIAGVFGAGLIVTLLMTL